jgi:hypothetical protein
MRHSSPGSPRRFAAALLVAALIAPAASWAEDEQPQGESAPAADAGEAAEPAPPVRHHWYDETLHQADIIVDLVLVRPLAAVTAGAGVILFVPAAIMTAPNGMESIQDAYGRFIKEPGEYFYSRPLGEF